MSQKLASYGQWTYRGAWALEITASIIGLATGLALGVQAFEASQSATAMDLVLASAPFFIVSIAELTKIPIATLLYSASWFWKPLLLIFLLLLAGITFETVLLGLERAGTLRELQYEEIADEIDSLTRENTKLADSDEAAKQTDQVAKSKVDLEEVSTLADKARKEIQARIVDIDAELQATTALTPEAAKARDQLKDQKQRRTDLVAERDNSIRQAVEEFERQRDSYVERIKGAREGGDTASAKRWEDEIGKLANPRGKIEAKYEPQIQDQNQKIEAASSEFDSLRLQSPKMTDEQKQVLQNRHTDLEKSLDEISADWERRLSQAREDLSAAQTAEATEAKLLAANQSRRDEIAKQLSDLEKRRIPLARTDQIRRIAARWYGEKPEQVSEAEAGKIAAIWFGSLAVIAGLAGPITAIVALGLQRIAAQAESRSESRLSRLIRRLLLRWRWRRVRTVKVPVEVPVDREVEKRIEVPIEKVVKEILYVPVLTDDPEALHRALNEELPAEVVDLVKVTAKGGRKRAGPA
ncbi:hypothetical protein FJ934_21185 [Mesorhizobium sp. B2-4-12]|uniref:hypothetical protein n=1 Tax=Mesorhizobium sp. B2-4-12 TaxID=2589937 RepID=UPI00112DAC3F|nr:hypothetical protein [Mesorhizobium sp. B2-4-12]TPK92214.1 hypothetical protein FJ934_21185 [Mesorhizobium sp. B2-4-12]